MAGLARMDVREYPEPCMARVSLQNQLRQLVRAAGVIRTADDANMNASKVSRWLSGERPIRANELEQIAHAVGYRIELVKDRRRDTERRAAE